MLLLLNAIPLMKRDDLKSIRKPETNMLVTQKRFSFRRLMKSLSSSRNIVNNGQHSLSENPILDQLDKFKNDGGNFEYLSTKQFGFTDSVEMAKQNGATEDQAKLWAYQHHDPYLDGYSIILKWLQNEATGAKNKMFKKMLKNPTLKKILEWEGGLDHSRANLIRAIQKGELDVIKYLVTLEVKPDRFDLYIAFRKGYLDIVKYFIEEGIFIPNERDLKFAIKYQNLDVFKYLVEECGINPTGDNLSFAITLDKLDFVRYMIIERKLLPNDDQLYLAIRQGYLDIFKCLINEGGIKPSPNHLNFAIRLNEFAICAYLIKKGVGIHFAAVV